ncbi:MAG TPA: FlgD immunoglobulin-like domain containing protein, partial [bacterium]|nr:FlgD immunoglobulin-like domain containing protein [bacterium]
TGTFSLYSGTGNELNRICLAKEGYLVQPSDAFTFQAWYDIESDWDYAYAILSTDGGRSFVNLSGTGTTMSDPNGNNADNGITGSSGGWQPHSYDLSAWVGQTVWLGFRFYSDAGVADENIYVDDIHPVQTWTTSTVLSSTIAGNAYNVSGQADGTYWYSVRGRDAEGDWGYPSADEPIQVAAATDAPLAVRGGLYLDPAVPSPFRGRTTVRFGLPRGAEHSLAVYDVSGRRIRVLSQGFGTEGAHRAVWDGRDGAGLHMPSGVYFLRLSSPGGDRVERAVMLR